jgi:hypothetical protein
MGEGFHLDILKLHWHELGHRYFDIWEVLRATDSTQVSVVIDADQIDSFIRAEWSFVLAPQISGRLANRFGEWLDKLTILKAAFVVAFGDEKLCGGVFIEVGSAAAIHFPVLYAEKVSERFKLYLRPQHSIRWPRWNADIEPRKLSGLERIVEVFHAGGKLVEQ